MKKINVVGNRLIRDPKIPGQFEFVSLVTIGDDATEYSFSTPVVEMVQIMLLHQKIKDSGGADHALYTFMNDRAIALTDKQAEEFNVLITMLNSDEVILDDHEGRKF